MNFRKKIRLIWHTIYYRFSGPKGVDFALMCRDVAYHIDHSPKPNSFVHQFRFWLHISLCQACKNYYDYSNFLSIQLKKLFPHKRTSNESIDEINKKIIQNLTNMNRKI